MTDVIELIMTAMFNGIGTSIGLYIFVEHIKPRIEKAHKKTIDIFGVSNGNGKSEEK